MGSHTALCSCHPPPKRLDTHTPWPHALPRCLHVPSRNSRQIGQKGPNHFKSGRVVGQASLSITQVHHASRPWTTVRYLLLSYRQAPYCGSNAFIIKYEHSNIRKLLLQIKVQNRRSCTCLGETWADLPNDGVGLENHTIRTPRLKPLL